MERVFVGGLKVLGGGAVAKLSAAGRQEPSSSSRDHAGDFSVCSALELISKNPIDLVRVKEGSKRRRIPRVLRPAEFVRLLGELNQPYGTMVLIAGGLGLRVSETVALQWGDFDWELLILTVTRGCVQGRFGEVKTEYSHQPLPLDPDLTKEILRWKGQGPYPNKEPKAFVFPSLDTENPCGRTAFWIDTSSLLQSGRN